MDEQQDEPQQLRWSMIIGGVEVLPDWRLQVRDPSTTGTRDAFFVLEVEVREFTNDVLHTTENYAVVQWDGRNPSHENYYQGINPDRIESMTDLTGNQYRRDAQNNFERVEGRSTRIHDASYMEEEIPSSDSDDFVPYQPAARRRVAPIPPSQRPSSIFDETSSSSSDSSSNNSIVDEDRMDSDTSSFMDVSVVDLFDSDVSLFDSDSS